MAALTLIGVIFGLFLYQVQNGGIGSESLSLKTFVVMLAISIKFYLPFSLFVSAIFEYKHLKTYKSLGIVSNSLNTLFKTEITVPYSFEKAFLNCEKSLGYLITTKKMNGATYKKRYEIIFSDSKAGLLKVKTELVSNSSVPVIIDAAVGRRRRIKREMLLFHLRHQGDNTKISIQSSSRLFFGLFDSGQNYLNISKLEAFFKNELEK